MSQFFIHKFGVAGVAGVAEWLTSSLHFFELRWGWDWPNLFVFCGFTATPPTQNTKILANLKIFMMTFFPAQTVVLGRRE